MNTSTPTTLTMPTTLCILTDGFEEIEAITPIDLLRRAGVEVTLASQLNRLEVCGRNGIQVRAEVLLDAVIGQSFDLLLLPGGPGVQALCEDARVLAITQDHFKQGKWVAAICAAPRILHAAGQLDGHDFTGHASLEADFPALIRDQAVVCSEKLITSRGAGTALPFGLELVKQLCGEAQALEIAASIHTK